MSGREAAGRQGPTVEALVRGTHRGTHTVRISAIPGTADPLNHAGFAQPCGRRWAGSKNQRNGVFMPLPARDGAAHNHCAAVTPRTGDLARVMRSVGGSLTHASRLPPLKRLSPQRSPSAVAVVMNRLRERLDAIAEKAPDVPDGTWRKSLKTASRTASRTTRRGGRRPTRNRTVRRSRAVSRVASRWPPATLSSANGRN